MATVKITKDNFENEVMKAGCKVLLDFWADWCPPCKMLSPLVDSVAEEMNNIKVGKINVDEEGELSSAFGITNIPTLVVIEGGNIVKKSVGYIPKDEIEKLIK